MHLKIHYNAFELFRKKLSTYRKIENAIRFNLQIKNIGNVKLVMKNITTF